MNHLALLLETHASRRGIDLQIDYDDIGSDTPCHVFHIVHIRRTDGPQGEGTRILRLLTQIADDCDIQLEIEHTRDAPKFGEIYASLGFEVTPDPTPTLNPDLVYMHRMPKGTPNL